MIARTKRPVTIHDVAKRAGVSFKTVSRVVNNETNVSPETQENVRKAIKALNYSPSIAARVLAGNRTFLIGLLYDTPSSYYIHHVQIGALERCRKAGFHVILEHCNSEARNAAAAIIAIIKNTRMDGVILTPPVSDSQEILEALVAEKVPHVLISPPDLQHDVSCVHMDNRRAAFDMTNYLISLGHKRIAFIKGHPRHGAARLRFQGYQDALENAGLPSSATLIKEGNFRFQAGVEATEQLLRQKSPPTAIFAANDEMATGALSAAHRMGYAIPDSISVVGFDDIFYASITWPALTTIRQPIAEMGDGAAGLLLAKILAKKDIPAGASSSLSFKYELKVRDSTGPAPRNKS